MSVTSTLEARESILVAARQLFRDNGVAGTTMSAVADAAGVHRRVIYRLYSGRDELIEAAIVARVREFIEHAQGIWDRYDNFADALIETTIITLNACWHDAEFRVLVEAESPAKLHYMLAGPYAPVEQLMLAAWLPRFAWARGKGELRTDVTDARLVEWLRGCYLQLMLRDDLDARPDALRGILRDFVLPSLAPR